MFAILSDLILVLFMALAVYGFGMPIRLRVPITFWNTAAAVAFTFGFGAFVTASVLFALSLVGLFTAAVGWSLLIIGLLLTTLHLRTLRSDLISAWNLAKQAARQPWLFRILLLLGVAWVLLNIIGDIAPPNEGDTVHQYMLLPRYWVEAGRYVQPTHIWAATLPGNAMLIAGWAMLLSPSFSVATLLVAFGSSIMVAIALYALARLYFNPMVGLMAVVFFYTMPDAAYLAQSGKVDMLWALFEILALASFLKWFSEAGAEGVESREGWRWLLLAGLFAGIAAGTKIQAFISVLLLTLWLIVFSVVRGQPQQLAKRVAVFLGLTVAGGFPFYLYNLIAHRSPFYPVFADQFVLIGGLASPRSELGTEVFYAWNPIGYAGNAIGMSIGHAPDLNFYLGFIVGPVFLMTLGVGVLLGYFNEKPIFRHLLAYTFVFSVVWFVVKQAARHFVPGLALLALVAAYVFWRVSQRRDAISWLIPGIAIAMVGINMLLILGVLYGNGTYRVALGMDREDYIANWHDNVAPITYPTWETVRALNGYDGERILAEHANGSLYIAPDLVSGNWGDRIDYTNINSEAQLLSALAENGIDYIMMTHAVEAEKPLFAQVDFLTDHADVVYRGERMTLYQLRQAR